MNTPGPLTSNYEEQLKRKIRQLRWQNLHLDPWLFLGLICLSSIGMFILYSAGNDSLATVERQAIRLGIGFGVMILFAQLPIQRYYKWTPTIFLIGLFLLTAVLVFGEVHQGARRWFHLGMMNVQPSEIMKLAMPMILAWYLSEKILPPKFIHLIACGILIMIPVFLTMKQPDLGTALMIGTSGACVLLLAGMSWRLILTMIICISASAPFLWHFMHQYQRDRVLTFLNPELDPLGNGYHIIQSKIALGSGGFLGKGWLHGTQSHLSFLPAHTTDFIFAVAGEELGLVGGALILLVFILILARCLHISTHAQNTYSRLLTGSLALTFIISAYVNIGMVIGILPVVGVPLPLISYGGSSMLTIFAGFGIIMSAHTHRMLWSS